MKSKLKNWMLHLLGRRKLSQASNNKNQQLITSFLGDTRCHQSINRRLCEIAMEVNPSGTLKGGSHDITWNPFTGWCVAKHPLVIHNSSSFFENESAAKKAVEILNKETLTLIKNNK